MSSNWLFALTGAVQGWLLWGLYKLGEHRLWPTGEPLWLAALAVALLAVPLLIYCTEQVQGLPPAVRRLAVTLLGLLLAGLAAAMAWSAGAHPATGLRAGDALVLAVLGFVLLGLLCGYDFTRRRWRYERLFFYAWRNGILLVTAAAMTAVFWGVLAAGAGLMALIGVRWVADLMRQPIFVLPVTALVLGAVAGLALARAGMIETIRRYTLSIAAWLLPLVLLFALLWVLALPWTGLDALFKTRSATALTLGFAALAVLFMNCAYQDGVHQAYPRWLARLLQWGWLALVVVVGVAWWALALRVAQHGWSEDRLWAALVAAVLSVHVLGYALSLRQPGRWMATVGATNVTAALLLCAGLLVFVLPPTEVRRVAVAAHLRHVQAAATEPDWVYLRWEAGRYGRAALQAIAAGTGVYAQPGWPQQAQRLLAQKSRHEPLQTQQMDETALASRFMVYPRDRNLPAGFVAWVRTAKPLPWELSQCLQTAAPCPLWLGDLDGDGQEEVLVFRSNGAAALLQPQGSGWQRIGSLQPGGRGPFDAAQLEQARPVPSSWQELQLPTGQRLRVQLN